MKKTKRVEAWATWTSKHGVTSAAYDTRAEAEADSYDEEAVVHLVEVRPEDKAAAAVDVDVAEVVRQFTKDNK